LRWFRRGSGPPATDRPVEPDPDDDPAALGVALVELTRYINRQGGQLPTAAVVKARWVVDTLQETLGTADTRPLDVYALLTVRNTARDYLPTTLRNYLALGGGALGVPTASGRTAVDLLLEQLDTLQESAVRTLTAVRAQDANALAAQGAFLSTKFSRSDLDL